ncbi:acyl-CoA 6-desaturase-like isoform X2 [Physella acuta]|nr:acyl-CoA 6-desaturase-like isoform X2 [Physella acuta]XP_059174717.1 acyl-CoA 6-desaturase-like isoform X2 [Physella acuta]XP_059174718.1 acyl-CoA 6-desaturase-like isoform X2 [Physella acuta]XP_059174719.1 acyl-CoA 6-desaturase-like isoform X2 [Physella acuta]XP_059174720.1 acyl-CoA 6-desaturase-like isoform X2 [Physella acuta]
MENGTKAKNGHSHAIQTVTFEEVSKHNKKDDQWLLINGKAYDITNFAKKHPGGAKILNHYAGEDATDAWVAFHNDKEKVGKFLQSLYVGDVVDPPLSTLKKDFRDLREMVVKSGWLKSDPWFYLFHFFHIIGLEVLAWCLLWYFGTQWYITLAAILILATVQAQAGWTQHDYGHHSVFPDLKRSHLFHHLTIGFMKGASSHWWNFRHFQHHAKPNLIKKDPDVEIAYLFLIGDKLPVEFGKKKKGFMPYQWQHEYFFLLGPPLLLPIYFHFEIIYFCLKRRDWLDLGLAIAFFMRFFYCYTPFFGGWGTFAFYMGMRFVESHWFTWVTQMSHLPNEVDRDSKNLDWFTLQLRSSCNVKSSWFNDWFTGHLNYQIEHHLFPTMPRMNYHKVAPLVESLCKKHGIEYRNKTLYTACADIIRMLKKSGQLWYDAYYDK